MRLSLISPPYRLEFFATRNLSARRLRSAISGSAATAAEAGAERALSMRLRREIQEMLVQGGISLSHAVHNSILPLRPRSRRCVSAHEGGADAAARGLDLGSDPRGGQAPAERDLQPWGVKRHWPVSCSTFSLCRQKSRTGSIVTAHSARRKRWRTWRAYDLELDTCLIAP